MTVIMPFHPGDQDQALNFARWLEILGGAKGHELLLIRDTRCGAEITEQIRSIFARSFESVTVVDFVDHWRKWPQSANEVFAVGAKWAMDNRKQYFFFCEPDCVLLKAGAFDEVEAEYKAARAAGKWFLGDLVTAGNSGVQVENHMSGNGVYISDLYEHAGYAMMPGDIAFDVAAAQQIMPQMQTSELILHRWKAEPFGTWADVQRRIFDVKPKAAIWHADKLGSLYGLLREKMKGGDVKCAAPVEIITGKVLQQDMTVPSILSASNSAPRSEPESADEIACDIFIKTYPKDYPWLEYCLRSIQKFTRGFALIEIVVPPDEGMNVVAAVPNFSRSDSPHFCPCVSQRTEYGENGYLSQQVFKLYADEIIQKDYILYTDSDTIFTLPVTPETFFTEGKINWMHTPYSALAGDDNAMTWKRTTQKFMGGLDVEFEFMRRHPFMVPRWLLAELREFCQKTHGRSLAEYVMAQESFSEFNVMGAYAYQFHRDKFNWINTAEVPSEQWPELTVLQKYSWGGLTPEIEKEFETILSGSTEGRADGGNDLTPPESVAFTPTSENQASPAQELQTPWVERATSIDELQRLSLRIKAFMTDSARTKDVRTILHKAEVITLPYRHRKRKGWRRKRGTNQRVNHRVV